MASAYWRTDHTVESLLQQREVGWEFLQLVKLLLSVSHESAVNDEQLTNSQQLIDDNSVLDILSKKIKFKASLASDFPPGEIREVQNIDAADATKITLIGDVLSAAQGPLPEPFVAWVKELTNAGDSAMADFLDIFNNRLLALRYLICRATRPNLIDSSASRSDSGFLLEALSGALFNRQAQDADLRLSGLLANNRLSFPVLKQLLRFCMSLPLISMNAYQGGWLTVDQSDHISLGKGPMCELGSKATLGKKVWDQQQAIELVIGPLSWARVKALVPGGATHREFSTLLERITDCRCDCKIKLLLPEGQVPKVQLGESLSGASISYTEVPSNDNNTNENSKNNDGQHEKLALGLTTVLPRAKQRSTQEKLIQVCFTVKTSNPGYMKSQTSEQPFENEGERL